MTLSIAAERYEEIQAFLQQTEFANATLEPLAGDASFRRYIRVYQDDKSAMLMDAPTDKEDVRPYVTIAQHLYRKGFSAPNILAQNPKRGLLLLEDLGSDSFSHVMRESDAQTQEQLYTAAIELLAAWHDPKNHFADAKQLSVPVYDNALLCKETLLFSQWFLPQILGVENAKTLAGEYEAIWGSLLQNNPLHTDIWVHRDYHADNLMWIPDRKHHKRVGLLDFQDGVYGDAAYDVVSLLEDARRDVPADLARCMIEVYVKHAQVDKEAFLKHYAILGAQRNMKIIGIFTRLATRDYKPHYLAFLPRVWNYLQHDISHPALKPLQAWLDKHVPKQYRDAITLKYSAQELKHTA